MGEIDRGAIESNRGHDSLAEAVELFYVVINDEEQYSIWSADGVVPHGWHVVGERDTREACLAYIEKHWTDMRPKSLRESMTVSG